MSVTAPVKLPRWWPKNSLSMSSVGIAPQLIATNGPSRRGPDSWIMRATSSLPVPDSPEMCTGAWLRETFAIIARTRSIAADSPTSPDVSSPRRTGSLPRSLSAAVTSLRRSPSSSGFETKSNAPTLSALTAVSTLPCAVITATGVPGASR